MKARQVSVVTPSARERASAARPAILIVVLIILVLVAIGLLPEGGMNSTPVGPRNPTGDGARALAQVLSNRGASVEEVSFDKAVTVDENTTLVVVFPSRLTSAQIQQIETRANVVYIGLEEEYGTEPYLDGLSSQRAGTYDTLTAPGCSSEIAARARELTSTKYVLSGSSAGWELCFTTNGEDFAYAERAEQGRFRAIIPDSVRVRNRAIVDRGNAALAINAIGRTPKVAWHVASYYNAFDDKQVTPTESPYVAPAFLMTIGAVLLAAVAMGRRLGPLTPERLPVEVPAAETLVGKARLMRSQRSYEHAASALRSASASSAWSTIARRHDCASCHARRELAASTCASSTSAKSDSSRSSIASVLGVAHTADRQVLIDALVQRGLPPSRFFTLLWGPPPRNEAALVTLANDLDALEKEIRHD